MHTERKASAALTHQSYRAEYQNLYDDRPIICLVASMIRVFNQKLIAMVVKVLLLQQNMCSKSQYCPKPL